MKYDTIEDGESTPLQGGSSNTAPGAAPNKTTAASSSTAIVRAFMIGTTAGALLMAGHSKMMNSSSNVVDNVYGTTAAATADSLVVFSSENYVGKKKKKKKRGKYEGNSPAPNEPTDAPTDAPTTEEPTEVLLITPAPTDPAPTSLLTTTPTIIEQIDQELNMTMDNVAGTCDLFVHVYNFSDKATVTLGQSGSPHRLLIKNAYYNGQQPPKALLDISGSVIGCDLFHADLNKPLAELTNVGIENCSWMFCDFKMTSLFDNEATEGANSNATFPCAGENYANICSKSTGINDVRWGIVWDMYFSKNNTITVEDNASIGTLLCHGDQFGSLAPDACANNTK